MTHESISARPCSTSAGWASSFSTRATWTGGSGAGPAAYAVLEKATQPAPSERYATVSDFVTAWGAACS